MIVSFVVSSIVISLMAKYILDWPEQTAVFSRLSAESCPKKGQRLYQELLSLNRFCLANGQKVELTRYKFFTEILDELIVFYRKEGANIFDHVMEIRKNLILDLKQEKKLRSLRQSSHFEMGIIAALGMGFVIFANLFAGISIALPSLAFAFGWQALGAGIFTLLQTRLRKDIFGAFHAHLKRASLLDVLMKTGQPVNLIAQKMRLDCLPKDQSLLHLRERIELILSQIKSLGTYDRELTKELEQECWFCHEQKLELFTQKLKSLKLLVVAVFFLGGYLHLFHSLILSLQV